MYNQDQTVNPKKLFVGNLPFSTTEDELREIFSQYGEIVEIRLISDRFTGRSKGIAFVEFTTEEQAQAAIEGQNNKPIGEREAFVSIARPPKPREERSGGSYGGNRGGGYNSNRGGGYNNNRGGGYNNNRGGYNDRGGDSYNN
jgi:cold-inducible RNA-binding protein